MDDFNGLMRKYYMSQSLSATEAEAILAQGDAAVSNRPFWCPSKLSAVAVALLLGLVMLLYLQRLDVTERVMAEIAMNHEKGLPIEVVADRYEAVAEQLDRLDFSVVPGNTRILSEFTLLGGRYCSIQGALAAQLKLRHARSGKISTLFVTKFTDDLGQVALRSSTLKGIRIQLWKEDGLLFGLAEDADEVLSMRK